MSQRLLIVLAFVNKVLFVYHLVLVGKKEVTDDNYSEKTTQINTDTKLCAVLGLPGFVHWLGKGAPAGPKLATTVRIHLMEV